MNFEKRERIESVLSFYSVKKLTESIDEIADAMLKDGFEYSDVKEYIKENLEEILGKQKYKIKFVYLSINLKK